MKAKRLLSMGLAAAVCVGTLGLAGCGSKGSDSAENTFSWWLYTDDGAGTYYNSFEDNPSVQWLNQQYWDTENHTLGTAEVSCILPSRRRSREASRTISIP